MGRSGSNFGICAELLRADVKCKLTMHHALPQELIEHRTDEGRKEMQEHALAVRLCVVHERKIEE